MDNVHSSTYKKSITHNLTHRTLSGFVWMISGKGIRFFLQLIIIAVLARLLSPEDFGVVAAALVVINFSEIFSLLGVGPALVQRPTIEERHIKTGLTTSIFLGTLFAIIIIVLAPYISYFFDIEGLKPVLRVLSVTFVIHGAGTISESLLQRNLLFKWLTLAQVVSYFIGYGLVGIYMAHTNYGIWALVAANIVQALVKCIIEFIGQPFKVNVGFELNSLKELLFFGTGFTLARIFNYIALHGDNIIVGRYLGAHFLGLYSRAYQLMATPATLFGDVLDKVLFPAMASVQDDIVRLKVAYLRGVYLIALIVLPISTVVFILAPEIVLTLFGPSWTEIIIPIRVLSISMLFRTSYKMSESLARATGAVYQRAWRQGIYAASILCGAWIGHHWGLIGVASGVVISLAINFILMAHLSFKLTGIKAIQFVAVHKHAAILSIIIFPALWLITYSMRNVLNSPVLVLMLSIVITILIYFVVIWFYPRILGKDIGWFLLLVKTNFSSKSIDYLITRFYNKIKES